MCGAWHYSPGFADETGPDVIRKLPEMFFANVTGGEPFVRQDLPEIIEELRRRAARVVISTNGFFTGRIIELCKKFPDLGIRISIDGLEETNDAIRGIPDGYRRAQDTLKKLREMGLKDIGFALTIQDLNYRDLVVLYKMAQGLDYEFATAAVHNSHYFHKLDNKIEHKEAVTAEIKKLIRELLKSRKVKEWFRGYFNYGLINYIRGNKRLLPCEMGRDGFFLDPWGDVLACNGMNEKMPMGNLKTQSWDRIWNSAQAEDVRQAVRVCKKNCWMIGSAAPAILHHPVKPVLWVLKTKFFGI
jgi:MoaA/NifB/PqqE/SkfB family radical SAM enzyme